MKTKVTIVGSDDGWDGLFIDDKLVFENHSIRISDLIHFLNKYNLIPNIDFRSDAVVGSDANQELTDRGGFPKELSKVKGLYSES